MARDTANPVALIVLDGWGYREKTEGNAIALADTPSWDGLWKQQSRTLLAASGLPVGLPEGQMGNSEVGHLNLGAGRIVMQDLVRISATIADRSFFRNRALTAACRAASRSGGTVHLVGLIGDGGVHAIDDHLFALIDLAVREQVPRIAIHAFVDGRDTLPMSGLGYMEQLLSYLGNGTGPSRGRGIARVATVSGRYYAMDRDRRWARTELAYRTIVDGAGPVAPTAAAAIRAAYDAGITDEFIQPVRVAHNGETGSPMRAGDSVICFNYRSDRMRQIVRAIADPDFDGFDIVNRPAVSVTTLTSYDDTLEIPSAFAPQSMARTLAETLSERGKSMLRTAETEKYPHVTYFFNGGQETPYEGEERILVASQKVATYDLMPEMSAPGVTDVLCNAIARKSHDFILCNYANADMVGHSGSLTATLTAVETVDRCLARVIRAAESAGVRLLITADHGNAELMIDPGTGGPHTAHTTNPVPFVAVGEDGLMSIRSGGALCDVAPTILRMLGVEQPQEMTGTYLGGFA
ncbi:MAG: 2,3-bisphosphoglycerate-independent phosphoglycerate mutase [Gemmatimonadaceae bacterium]